MFGRSSNGVKGMMNVQRLKSQGGVVQLSLSQIVICICNGSDAKANLSPEEFAQFRAIFETFRRETKCIAVNMDGYLQMCDSIISTFEQFIPFMLIDGEHSNKLEMRNQIKIRKMYDEGIRFRDAVYKYEFEYETIGQYTNYDPVGSEVAKELERQEKGFAIDFVQKFQLKPTLADYGFLMGAACSLYYIIASRFGGVNQNEDSALSINDMLGFAILDFSDDDIHVIMKNRQETAASFLTKLGGSLPNTIIAEKVSQMVIERYRNMIPSSRQGEVQKNVLDYYNNLVGLYQHFHA